MHVRITYKLMIIITTLCFYGGIFFIALSALDIFVIKQWGYNWYVLLISVAYTGFAFAFRYLIRKFIPIIFSEHF